MDGCHGKIRTGKGGAVEEQAGQDVIAHPLIRRLRRHLLPRGEKGSGNNSCVRLSPSPLGEKVSAKLTDEGGEMGRRGKKRNLNSPSPANTITVMPHETTKPGLRANARALRANQTEAEALLWARLRNRRLLGPKFKRQVPIRNYIADFLCAQHRLIIEVDGSQHAENEYDQRRDRELARRGFTVLRFWNNDILNHRSRVCKAIIAAVQKGMAA